MKLEVVVIYDNVPMSIKEFSTVENAQKEMNLFFDILREKVRLNSVSDGRPLQTKEVKDD